MAIAVRRVDLRCFQPAAMLTAAAAALMGLVACSSQPARIEPPSINASRAGDQAMEQYDTDGNGIVEGDELSAAPGFQAAIKRLDTDGDGGVSADEVAALVERWQGTRKGIMSIEFAVTLNGRPLEGATVTFEPEEFLGDEIKPASGVTDYFGVGSAAIAKEDRPAGRPLAGMHLGLYLVKISKVVDGHETIPARYNDETVFGQEVAPFVPEIGRRNIVYAIKTK